MKKFLVASSLLVLASCNSLPDWLGGAEEEKLPGKRYAVMEESAKIYADSSLASDSIDLTPETTKSYTSSQIVDAGNPPESGLFITYQPIIDDGKIFVIDGESKITALDAKSLTELWSKQIKAPEEDSDLPGGGLAYGYGVLYASTGFGYVVAVSSADGTEIWRRDLGMALRRPPVVVDDKIYAVTTDNQLFCLSAVDGSTVWRHTGASETTSIYGSSMPAVKNEVAVIAYSSGEVFGINTSRGNELWSELIGLGSDRRSAAAGISDVVAAPVIVDGMVYIGGHGGDLAAFNLTNGFRIWSQKLGSINSTPAVYDKWIFAIASNHVVALNRFDGRVKWVVDLQKTEDKKEIVYSGPAIGDGKLLITSSNGKLLQLDPRNGSTLSTSEISDDILTAPVVDGKTAYIINSDSDLEVLR
jgi:outer membrane protein assembly factor BamB